MIDVHPMDSSEIVARAQGAVPGAGPSPSSLVEVVSVAAESMGLPVPAVQTALVAALTRAKELGLGVADVLDALAKGE